MLSDLAANENSQGRHFESLRTRMVEQQLRRRGISDERVIQAMLMVPREEFVDPAARYLAYDDCPLSIGFGQTISQPYTVAYQCELLLLKGNERVLEIGTGSGYAAAVLSLLAREVFSVERIPELAARAKQTLLQLGYANAHVVAADGTDGLPTQSPFDAIVASAGGEKLPEPLVAQLASHGRIVIPLGSQLGGQQMYRYIKLPDRLQVETLGEFSFVPLIGRHGWQAAL